MDYEKDNIFESSDTIAEEPLIPSDGEKVIPSDEESAVLPEEETTVAEAAAEEASSVQKDIAEVDGEYHFANPERRLYEDAEFVPQDETTTPPHYYVPSEKKPKEKNPEQDRKKKRYLKVAALCLACAILGGLVGGGAVSLFSNRSGSAQSDADTEKPISSEISAVSKGSSNANDIYSRGCQQVVGITTSVNFTNFFGQTSSTAVSGSGFVVTADGYILTNFHVIEYSYGSDNPITVMFKDGTSYEATIVGVEEENDIAVLKIDASGLVPATMGDSSSINVGDIVYAIGNPLGELDFSMSTGSVSALDRSIATEDGTPAINMFQIDAAVNSGNSGGPVYNTSGEVIGIVTAKSGISGTEGLGFAIPINDAVDIANDLITKGYVTGKAYMGVNIDTRYTSVYAEYYNMPEGAYVFSVESGSCAEAAGITAGNIITAIGDNEIKSYSDLSNAIRQYKAGDTAEIVVYRNSESVKLSITFDEAKPSTSESPGQSGPAGYPQSGGFFS